MSQSDREFDLIIFGATGFTGFFILRELVLTLQDKEASQELPSLKYAIAGRNQAKLEETLTKLSAELSADFSKIPIVLADVGDVGSLNALAKRTKVLINGVGPYRFFGRPVVEACLAQGTHHVDISGEPQYIEQMQLDHFAEAEEKKTLIVSTCGWDSIPCDLGVDFLKKNFGGRLHSVETFMETIPGPDGYKINFGTLQSAIYGYAYGHELGPIRRRLYSEVLKKKVPRSRVVLKRKTFPFTVPQVSGYNLEFPGSDRSVVQRTQAYNYERFDEFPVQIQTYFVVQSFLRLIGTAILGLTFGVLASFSAGRSMLESYPELFTFNVFTKKGPTRAMIDSTKFRITLVGKGWQPENTDNQNVEAEPSADLNRTVVAQVSGADPGYRATSTCIVQAALTILADRDKMPEGGVLTPASAFRQTKLLDRLQKRGLKFELISEQNN